MLYILLLLLKIIGITLLVVLGLVLLILLLVLFVPIRYRLQGEKYQEVKAEADITWMLHLLHVHVAFEHKKLQYYVKVAWKNLAKSMPEEPSAEQPEDRAVEPSKESTVHLPEEKPVRQLEEIPTQHLEEEPAQELEEKPAQQLEENPAQQSEKPRAEERDKKAEEQPAEAFSDPDEFASENFRKQEPESDTHTWKDKINAVRKKIAVAFTDTQRTIQSIHEKIRDLKITITRYQKFLTNKVTKAALSHIKKECFYLLKHFLPKMAEGHIHIGFEDPSQTGKVFGYLCVINALTHYFLQVEPDFEKKVIEGDLKVSGHIRLCHVVKSGLSLILDRNIIRTLKRLKKLKG